MKVYVVTGKQIDCPEYTYTVGVFSTVDEAFNGIKHGIAETQQPGESYDWNVHAYTVDELQVIG